MRQEGLLRVSDDFDGQPQESLGVLIPNSELPKVCFSFGGVSFG